MRIGAKEVGNNKTWERLLFWAFLLMGIAVRVWRFGEVPGDLNQDEAYAGYEAWSLLHYGVDSNGYSFPVYLEAWGSGMNALNTYLMIPFIALFGLKVWVIRLPQLIVAILTLCAVYGIVRRLWNNGTALCVLFFLAICPWHIMLSRWGLESNLAPGFVTFGLYFFLRGLEKPRFLLWSALCYGMSLYCYATIWPFVPLLLVLETGYCLACRKLKLSWELLWSAVLLFVLALPLLLFLLVNKGVIAEICLPFLSIPKMAYFRGGEISLSQVLPNLKNLAGILCRQSDELLWNAAAPYGLYYRCSIAFFLLGLVFYLVRAVKAIRKKQFCPEVLLLIQLFAGVLLGMLIQVNINRVNIIFLPMLVIMATGAVFLCELLHCRRLLLLPFAGYLAAFASFCVFYFTTYQEEIGKVFYGGFQEALEEASSYKGTIYVGKGIHYPVILFYEEIPVTEYLDTVILYDYPGGARDVVSFDRFCYLFQEELPDPQGIYIWKQEETEQKTFAQGSFVLKQYGSYTVAVPVGASVVQ